MTSIRSLLKSRLQRRIITTSGNIALPPEVELYYVTLIGGGGGGSSASPIGSSFQSAYAYGCAAGNGGNSGNVLYRVPVVSSMMCTAIGDGSPVTCGRSMSCTIGSGGAGGPSRSNVNYNGSNISSFINSPGTIGGDTVLTIGYVGSAFLTMTAHGGNGGGRSLDRGTGTNTVAYNWAPVWQTSGPTQVSGTGLLNINRSNLGEDVNYLSVDAQRRRLQLTGMHLVDVS